MIGVETGVWVGVGGIVGTGLGEENPVGPGVVEN